MDAETWLNTSQGTTRLADKFEDEKKHIQQDDFTYALAEERSQIRYLIKYAPRNTAQKVHPGFTGKAAQQHPSLIGGKDYEQDFRTARETRQSMGRYQSVLRYQAWHRWFNAEDEATTTKWKPSSTLGKEIDRLEKQAILDAELNAPMANPLTGKPNPNWKANQQSNR